MFYIILLSQGLNGQCLRQSVIDNYNNVYLTTAFTEAELAWTGDIASCDPGTISASVQQKMLDRFNYYRDLCGLNADVVFNSVLDAKCQEAALMQQANNTLNHCVDGGGAPCNTFLCNTPDAIEASQSSNLAWADWDYFNPIDMYIEDAGSFNTAVGHRRWLLHSKGKTYGNGTTSMRNAMWVFDNFGNPTGNSLDYIAYPPSNFIVQELVFDRWSFGIPNANFENAKVDMFDADGNTVALNIVDYGNIPYGDPTIVWEPLSIDVSNVMDVEYVVTVSDIQNAPQSSYTYTVTIVPNVFPPNCEAGKIWSLENCQCEEICPEILIVDDLPIEGTYVSDSLIVCDNTIEGGNIVLFEAGELIELANGFTVDQNCEFEGTINPIACNVTIASNNTSPKRKNLSHKMVGKLIKAVCRN